MSLSSSSSTFSPSIFISNFLSRERCNYKIAPQRFTHSQQLLLFFTSASSSAIVDYDDIKPIQSRNRVVVGIRGRRRRGEYLGSIISASSSSSSSGNNVSTSPLWETWIPNLQPSKATSLSDVVWPSAGAFVAMAVLGKMDQMLAPKGLSITIAPFGAVCAVLFATPSTPAARKYNMFVAQMGCAAIGVLAFSIFGPGWLARSTGLAAAIAFMITTRAIHPPAASLPLLFIDAAKLQHLKFWYALFPGAAGCILLCLIQEVVSYLKDNVKF